MEIADIRFLIAENHDFDRTWLASMLANLGARHVTEVVDGRAALQVLQDPDVPIDITLLEIDLPSMDGMELIRHISKGEDNCAFAIVSGHDQSLLFSVETMSKAYGVEVLGTLEKPVSPESLKHLVERFAQREARRSTRSSTRQMTLDEITEGLANDQFLPYFQPKIDLMSRQVVGVEAFARWPHPKFGMLAPATFIPVLESLQLMGPLTNVIIQKSLDAAKLWQQQDIPLTVSVNVSPSVLAEQDFAERVIGFAAERGVEPRGVIFEITESGAVTEGPHFLENLARLRMHGFGLSVDDYGTGKTSLQQLMRIPFSELKIDRSFVTGAESNHAIELVLSSSIAVCHRLDRRSVAVGVETRQDWDFLLKLGCTYAQGYYIAKPMEREALPNWMEEWALFF